MEGLSCTTWGQKQGERLLMATVPGTTVYSILADAGLLFHLLAQI